jgi:leader peptidase (prepilin peptidase)/N-methyltransferase
VTVTFVALFGLVIGSFLNVVVARLPEHESLRGRSACRRCGAMIATRDNIPLLSFALLGGRCRSCRAPIPWRYPLIELGTAAAFVAAVLRFGLTPRFALASAFLAALIAISAIDLDHQIIPDAIALPGVLVGLVLGPASGLTPRLEAVVVSRSLRGLATALASDHARGIEAFTQAAANSVLGVVVCGGLLFLVIVVSGWIYTRINPELPGGMGMGDMKLSAMLGAFLGWQSGLFALFIAVMAGGVIAAGLLLAGRKGRKDAVPFGPFLALGGAVALFVEPPDFLGL